MSVEQSLFRDEEERFMWMMKTAQPNVAEEGLRRFLNDWFYRKEAIIDVFGGLRIEGPVELGTSDDEEGIETTSISADQIIELYDTCIREMDGFMYPKLLLIWAKKDSSFQKLLSSISADILLDNMVDAHQGNESFGKIVADYVSAARRHPVIELKVPECYSDLTKMEYLAKMEYLDLITGACSNYVSNYAVVNFRNVLYRIINITPIEKLLQNKTSSGMKFTKFLRTLLPEYLFAFEYLDKSKDFWYWFGVVWSQVLQKLKTSGEKVIASVSPVDFVTMSETSSWSSCHNIRGQYPCGGLGYCLDPYTALAFVPRSKMITESVYPSGYADRGIHGTGWGVPFHDKEWRQLTFIDIDNKSVAFGRQYPQDRAGYYKASRYLIMRKMAEYVERPSKWVKRSGGGSTEGVGHYSYFDGFRSNCQLKDVGSSTSGTYSSRHIPCLRCGKKRISVSAAMLCHECYQEVNGLAKVSRMPSMRAEVVRLDEVPDIFDLDSYVCQGCSGDYYPSDMYHAQCCNQLLCLNCIVDDHEFCDVCNTYQPCNGSGVEWVEYRQEHICEDCRDELGIRMCFSCEEFVSGDEGYYIEDAGEWWCEGCYERYGWYCECCDHYFSDNVEIVYVADNGENVCINCAAEHYYYCDCCGEYYGENVTTMEDDCTYCEDCLSEYAFTCDKCGDLCLENTHEEALAEQRDMGYLDRYNRYCTNCWEDTIKERWEEQLGQDETA